ncbi:hypothetical protein Y032_0767g2184 [Ancylostoma ceylanicum]|nr:hypothetical protein Y032_0767g2184 [Ancylostoma ceylanicum]
MPVDSRFEVGPLNDCSHGIRWIGAACHLHSNLKNRRSLGDVLIALELPSTCCSVAIKLLSRSLSAIE